MEEHIRKLKQLKCETAGQRVALDLAVELMWVSTPKNGLDEEKKYPDPEIRRLRAQARAEGYASRSDEVEHLLKKIAELRRELETEKTCLGLQKRRLKKFRTKLLRHLHLITDEEFYEWLDDVMEEGEY